MIKTYTSEQIHDALRAEMMNFPGKKKLTGQDYVVLGVFASAMVRLDRQQVELRKGDRAQPEDSPAMST